MKFYIVDCFVEEKYQGNELLVIRADRMISEEEQQKIAREINFSETSFILSDRRENGGYDVRIWTPNTGEVPFAGHPVLGTAHIIHHIYEKGRSNFVKLNLKVGQITASVSDERITMAQNPPVFGECTVREEVAEIYGITAADIREDVPIQWVSTGLESVIIPLCSREALSKLTVDRDRFTAYVRKHPKNYCNHLFFADMKDHTFAVRCIMEDFLEDPATGSAAGDLAGYLLNHDYFGCEETDFTILQGEDMGRRSVLYVHAAKKENAWTIEVGGKCFVVAEGEWL